MTQLPDGNWDEPWYTGTGFPGDFYLNYHLYRLVFPLSALGRWCRAVDDASAATGARTEAAHQSHAGRAASRAGAGR
jgi:squalene-hopene/tetraprenyl-beta-curcumene cyclase